jgi:O-antigen ligase
VPDKKGLSSLALGLALMLTFAITLIKGGALPWASLYWVALCGFALSVILIIESPAIYKKTTVSLSALSVASIAPKDKLNVLLPAYFLFAFQLWALFQVIVISPDKAASLNQSLIGFGMLFLLAIWLWAAQHPKALSLLYYCFILSAAMQSIYGLWIYLSGTDLLLWMPKLHYLDRPTGLFVNANHFAAYILLGIILCLSRMITKRPSQGKKHLLTLLSEQLYSPVNAILCLLVITLVASKSVGAMTALAVVLGLMSIQIIRCSDNKKTLVFFASAFFCALIFIILSLDYSIFESEIADFIHSFTRRVDLSKAAFTMLKSNWLTGIGGGTFYSQFSPYRTLEIGNSYYNYAHNDVLQFGIEYGVIGIILLFLFVGAALRANVCMLSRSPTGINATFAIASIYSTVAVSVHSIVDFPLHIPGFSVCYLVLISINSLNLISHNKFKDVAEKQ